MTPSESSSHQDKTLVPVAEHQSQSHSQPAEHSTTLDTIEPEGDTEVASDDTTSETATTAEAPSDEDTALDTEHTALIRTSPFYTGSVYHLIDDNENGGQDEYETADTTPLCGVTGEFTRVSKQYAREHTTGRCQNCTTAYTGGVDCRPCPQCGQAISTTHWPQHIRTCQGDGEDKGDSRDTDEESA